MYEESSKQFQSFEVPPPPRRPRRRRRSWLRRLFWIGLFAIGVYFAATLVLGWWMAPAVGVHDGSWVELRFTAQFPESLPDRTGLAGALGPTDLSASDVRALFRAVARDHRIRGILVRPDGFAGSWAQVEELVAGLGRLRDRGIEVVAYTELATHRSLAIASACDEVVLAPEGMLLTVGLEARLSYLAGSLSKVGVEADFVAVGQYKSAPEQLERTEPSEPSREQAEELLAATWTWWLDQIADSRGLDRPTLVAAVESSPLDAASAAELGLVDRVVDLGDWCEERGLDPRADLVDPLQYLAQPPAAEGDERVAVVYVDGSIAPGGHGEDPVFGRICGADDVVERLTRAREDGSVSAVIVRVDSPGGSASASHAIYRAVQRVRTRKPVVVSTGGAAASGGYYVAMGADEIVADSLTVTGSIGVFSGKLVLAGLYDKLGMSHTSLRTTENAGILGDLEPFDDSQRERLQDQLESFYQRFVGRVADDRGLEVERVLDVAGGRVWSGQRARDFGLVDQLGDFEVAVERAEALAGLSPGSANLVDYRPRPGFYERMLRGFFGRSLRLGVPQSWLSELAAQLPGPRSGFDGSVQYRLPWRLSIR